MTQSHTLMKSWDGMNKWNFLWIPNHTANGNCSLKKWLIPLQTICSETTVKSKEVCFKSSVHSLGRGASCTEFTEEGLGSWSIPSLLILSSNQICSCSHLHLVYFSKFNKSSWDTSQWLFSLILLLHNFLLIIKSFIVICIIETSYQVDA